MERCDVTFAKAGWAVKVKAQLKSESSATLRLRSLLKSGQAGLGIEKENSVQAKPCELHAVLLFLMHCSAVQLKFICL